MKNKLNLPIKTYLFYLILVAVLITGTSFSRYTVTIGGQDSITMAKLVFEVDITDNLDTKVLDFNNIQPRDSQDYEISISNYNGTNTSDIASEFYIVITAIGDLPLEFTLTEDAPEGTVYSIDTETNTITTTIYDLGIAEIQNYNFNFNIYWDAIYDDPQYESLSTTITLTVNRSQKK